MPIKLRYCSKCKGRTAHDGRDNTLLCTQCVKKVHNGDRQVGEHPNGGLVSAMRLCHAYPRAAYCFFVHAIKIPLKVCLFVAVFAKVVERGFFVSAVVVAVGFFAIECFGPRGSEKSMAVEFGKRLWTTLINR